MRPLTLEQACSPQQLLLGWQRIRRNRGSQGMDDFAEPQNIEAVILQLHRELISGNYQPRPLLFVPTFTNGKKRELALPSIHDRVIQSGISLLLIEYIDLFFEDCSFAYRPERSIQMAQAAVLKHIHSGRHFIVRADVKDCFDTVEFGVVKDLLAIYIQDHRLVDLIMRFISAPLLRKDGARVSLPARRTAMSAFREGQLIRRSCGIPQGAPLSPLLCNIVLDVFDKEMVDAEHVHVRYADDLVLLGFNRYETHAVLSLAQQILSDIGLQINRDKTYETHWQLGFQFLGESFRKGD